MRAARDRLMLKSLCAMVFGVLTLACVPAASATIRYQVSISQPEQHIFHVQMEIPHAAAGETIAMPAWNALYQIRDFAYRVRDVEVEHLSTGEATPRFSVAWELDKQDWSLGEMPGHGDPAVRPTDDIVSYSIAWNDPGPFDTQLTDHHAFINLAEILMYVPDRRDESSEVDFQSVPSGWKVIAQLASGPRPDSFTASSYEALVDAPVEAGNSDEFEFDNDGAHFRVVVDSRDWDKGLLREALRRITGYELKLMGGPPFSEYTFIFHIGAFTDVGGGGMEHMNSTAIAATSTGRAAAIAAHEFFHAWNVKRIRPQTLQPVDYSKEQYTRALWFAEGVTSAYASYTLERTKLWSKEKFYEDLASQIADLQSRPARKWQSVEASSLDAWFEKYDDYNLPSRSISYYEKGQILGVMLDLAIRDATDNHKSLDDVMRRMNDEYAKAGRYYNDSEGVLRVVNEVSGKDFSDFFRRYVSGTDEIPYDQFLSVAGLRVNLSTASDGDPAATIEEVPHPSARQRRIREGLLRGITE
ncbi:MAG: M61 family metallopeptidase [Candidatus Acidiferrales bacterium]